MTNTASKLLLLFLLCASATFAQNALVPIPPTFLGPASAPRLGANLTITFCTSAATGVPCSPLAQAYADSTNGSPINQVTNPLKTDALGNAPVFYAAPGQYSYTITGPGLGAPQGPFQVFAPCVPGVSCILASANNTFTGNNTFSSGTTTISNLAGPTTVTGNNTHSGTETFSGPIIPTTFDTTIYVGNSTYPCTATGVNAALTAARGTGITGTGAGAVDATACTGNVTMNAQINVGDTAQDAVLLILPASGTWDFNMTDGVSCGIKQFGKTQILGHVGGVSMPFGLLALTGANLKAVYCTDPTPGGSSANYDSIRAEGFSIKEQSGVTLSTAVADITNLFDGSGLTDLVILSNGHVGLNLTNLCCGMEIRRIVVDCVNTAGCLPVRVNSTVNDVIVTSLSAGHAGAGLSQISIVGPTLGLTFNGIYMETNTNGVDTSSPLIDLGATGGGSVNFYGGMANIVSGVGSAQYVFKRETGANPLSAHIFGFHLTGSTVDLNCINDAVTGLVYQLVNGTIEKNNGICPDYFPGTTQTAMVIGRSGVPAGMLTLDYNSSIEQGLVFRNNAASGKSWYAGDGVAQVGRFSLFDVGGAERLGIDTTGFLRLPTAGSAYAFGTTPFAIFTAPTIAAAGCGGGAASITASNGTAAFKINVGTTPGSACTITMPAATTGWNVSCSDITTQSTSVFVQKQTGAESTTSVTITNFNDVAAATAFVASDLLKCTASAD